MNTGNLLATFALVNQIDAARIDVDQLFARQAFIDQLNTSVIQSQDFIQLVVGQVADTVDDAMKEFHPEEAKVEGDVKEEKCREFVSFMLCRQAKEIASYAHDMLVAGIITDADMDELNKSIVMAFGLTADEVRRQRDEIDAKIKARLEAYKAMRAANGFN